MAILERVKVKLSTLATAPDYFFMAPVGLYAGGIATAVGVTKAGDDDEDEPLVPVYQLLQTGRIIRLTATVEKTSKRYRVGILCPVAKIPTAQDELLDKIINLTGRASDGGKIVSIGVRLRASFT